MIKLPLNVGFQLHTIACDEITQSHDDAYRDIAANTIRPSQWETIFTAHLCRVMPNIARKWKTNLSKAQPGLGLSMATVFTHQTPYVTWNLGSSKKRCELADILFAVIDRTLTTPKGRAVLVQAKLTSTGTVTLSNKSEKTQFELLSGRPVFDVDAATVPAPTRIDLSRYFPDTALTYGLTSPNSSPIPNPKAFSLVHQWFNSYGLFGTTNSYSVQHEHCLAYLLVGMLLGNFGWEFDLPPSGQDWQAIAALSPRDDWSTLINYLLEETFTKALSGKQRAAMGRSDRGQEDTLHLKATNSLGLPMFFSGYEISESMVGQFPLRKEDIGTDFWQPNPDGVLSVSGNGNSTDNREPSESGESPEGGPISAVLIEFGMQD